DGGRRPAPGGGDRGGGGRPPVGGGRTPHDGPPAQRPGLVRGPVHHLGWLRASRSSHGLLNPPERDAPSYPVSVSRERSPRRLTPWRQVLLCRAPGRVTPWLQVLLCRAR